MVSGNIKSGVKIFNVTGSLGDITSLQNVGISSPKGNTTSTKTETLSVTPKYALLESTCLSASYYTESLLLIDCTQNRYLVIYDRFGSMYYKNGSTNVSMSGSGAFSVNSSNGLTPTFYLPVDYYDDRVTGYASVYAYSSYKTWAVGGSSSTDIAYIYYIY